MESTTTALYGLIGWPIAHSASPAMINAAFQHMNLDAAYVSFPVKPEDIEEAMKGLRALGVKGVNVTIPHKQVVFQRMSRLTPEATLAQAVNTVLFDEVTGELVGHNTDVGGWWESIRVALPVTPQSVVMLGTGGAARAIATALSLHAPASELHLVARNPQRAETYIRDYGEHLTIQVHPWAGRHRIIEQAQLVVNATPIGMWPNVDVSPVESPDCFHDGQVVQDIVYRPLRTTLMNQASGRGATVVDGLGMLIHQGALAIEFWLSQPAPATVMRNAAESFLVNEDRSDGNYNK